MMRESEDLQYTSHKVWKVTELGPQGASSEVLHHLLQREGAERECLVTEQSLSLEDSHTSTS